MPDDDQVNRASWGTVVGTADRFVRAGLMAASTVVNLTQVVPAALHEARPMNTGRSSPR